MHGLVTDLLALWQQLGNTLPDASCTPLQGESEDCVRAPPCILLVVDDIPDSSVHIYCGYTLS